MQNDQEKSPDSDSSKTEPEQRKQDVTPPTSQSKTSKG
jgi:hypothetical protein